MSSTTINMNSDVSEKLNKISKKINVSKTQLIKDLLYFVFRNLDFEKYFANTSRYQKKIPGAEWEQFHINYSELDCDVFLICRFQFRISVSKLVFIGFCLFLQDVIDFYDKGKEKISKDMIDSYSSFTQYLNQFIEDEMIILRKKYKNTA